MSKLKPYTRISDHSFGDCAHGVPNNFTCPQCEKERWLDNPVPVDIPRLTTVLWIIAILCIVFLVIMLVLANSGNLPICTQIACHRLW